MLTADKATECFLNDSTAPPPQDASIPVPHHIVVSRDGLPPGDNDPQGFIEREAPQ